MIVDLEAQEEYDPFIILKTMAVMVLLFASVIGIAVSIITCQYAEIGCGLSIFITICLFIFTVILFVLLGK